MNDLYVFEDSDLTDDLVLHMPDSPGSSIAVCGRVCSEEETYLPDPDESISSFCPECQPAWVDFKTTNPHNWRFV